MDLVRIWKVWHECEKYPYRNTLPVPEILNSPKSENLLAKIKSISETYYLLNIYQISRHVVLDRKLFSEIEDYPNTVLLAVICIFSIYPTEVRSIRENWACICYLDRHGFMVQSVIINVHLSEL